MRVLGPLELWRDEAQVELGGVKQRALLAHLALNANRGVSVDQLVEVLWPAGAPRSVVANIRTYVWQLRQLLDTDSSSPRLRTHGAGYVLVVSPHEVDALHFAELVESARVEPSPVAALEVLRRAESFWRGQPLEDLPASSSWSPVLARLAESRLAATEQRLALQVSLGESAAAIPELRALLSAHPYRESVCLQLMIALRRAGRQVEALQVYTGMRDRLTDELGLEPGTELREAHLAVLRGDDEPAAARPSTPIHQLPPAISDFSGRATQTARLVEVLRTSASVSVPVAEVTGPPGVGKSTLAVRVAHEVRDHFPDGQLYVDLAGTADDPRDPGDVLGELLHAFGVNGAGLPAGVPARAALYRSLLAGRRVLVLLDDAASVSQVAPLLPADPGCGVLVTSRRRLTDLPGASHLELRPFHPDEAAELLAMIAGRDRITAEPEDAAAIARACGHLPLAIRVAGARLAGRGGWSLRVLRERLIDESTRLRELRSGELAVRASFDLSVRQLPADGLRAFVLLALLGPHDVPGWVVDALLDQRDADQLVDQLVDANLLGSPGTDRIGQPRYRLHDLLRCHARELADRLPGGESLAALERTLRGWLWLEGQAAARLPATFGATIADRGGWALDPGRARHLLSDPVEWFVAERRTVCGAVDLAADAGLDDLAWRLAATAVPFFDLHSHYEDWARTHSRALQACRAAGNKAGEAAMARGLAQVHIYRNEFDEAEREMLDAHRLYGETGDERGEGIALAGVGTVCRLRAENERAMRCYEQSLRKLESADDRHSIAQVRASIGSIHTALGDLEQGRTWLTSALELARAIGDAHREALVLCRLAALHRQAGEHDVELDHARRAVSILEELTDERCTAFARLELAEALIPAGKHDAARELVHRALATYRKSGNKQGEPAALRTLARVALAEGARAAGAPTT
ncbi:AfsR/SARP family transcriptional regulator [Lentzea tibetensis]|uniref:AfsR/SARP family transcriptional regulator n=1 Tax=Lentzea tibetensis TaxID=2591470 RepID=UPI001F385809|nr:BTAD domain-containing putative transcriptional regulator [Lentzea tibetensis]